MKIDLTRLVCEKCHDSNVIDKALVLDYLKGRKFKRIFDAGCNNGDLTMEAARAVEAEEVCGAEIDDDMVKSARSKGVNALKLDLNYALPYEDDYFDLILSIQNIEHLYFTDIYLREAHRILKKDGIFFVATTNLAAIHYRVLLLFGIQPMCLHPSVYQTFPLSGENPLWGHKSVFTYGALKGVLKKHSFEIIKSYTHTIYFLPSWLSGFILRILPGLGTFSHYVVRKSR